MRLLTWPCVAAGSALVGQLVWLLVVHGTPCRSADQWIVYVLALLGGVAEANAARVRGGGIDRAVAWGFGSAFVLLLTALVIDYAVASEGGCFS